MNIHTSLVFLLLAACGDNKIVFPADDTGADTDLPDTPDTGDTGDTGEPTPGARFDGSRRPSDAGIVLVSKNESDAVGWENGLAALPDLDGDGADELLVAAKNTQDTSGNWYGAVYLIASPPMGMSMLTIARTTFVGEGSGMFGTAVAHVGDVDGDGEQDIAIGAPRGDEGVVHIFQGPFASGEVSAGSSDAQLTGESVGSFTGTFVQVAGDVDEDGLDDVLVSSYHNDTCDTCGTVYISLAAGGAGTSSLASNSLRIAGGGSRGPINNAAATADFDGDGSRDVLVGAAGGDLGGAGIWYGPFGSGDSTLDDADAWFTGSYGSFTGLAVTGLDLDGDGYDEIVAGAPYSSEGGTNSGAVYVERGASVRHTGTTDLTGSTVLVGLPDEYVGMRFGAPVDLDEDGREDMLISSPYGSLYELYGGVTYLFYGDPVTSGSYALPDVAADFTGDEAGSQTGWALAGGDFNGDGAGDVATGSMIVNMPQTGGAYVYLGE